MSLFALKNNIKQYFKFSNDEIKAIIVTTIILGFVASFSEWGKDVFDFKIGFINYFNAALIVGLAILVRVSVQRIAGLWVGLRVEYKEWFLGLMISLVLVFVTKGKLMFLVPGGIFLHFLERQRLGSFRYGLSYGTVGFVCFWGVVANVFLATVFKVLSLMMPYNPLLAKAVIINMWMALFSMLPIPPLDGSRIFFAVRGMYVFVYGVIIGWALLLNFTTIFYTIIGALVIGTIIAVIYYILYEKGAWAPF